ncbi:dynamin family protein [Bacillus sp. FJAT-49736]|uniref:dynamin family protein n=1 Tax=Bacillus sp. FJAT-49736 TaxID=2833582 RepID=UPI001BC94F0C|nr:dynamin family protein [Bacillus sp. FJAT-49736]MBS4173219.1 dynamin family protein [Bacillus sp. FJAT-49736]
MIKTIDIGNIQEATTQLVGFYERFKENGDMQRAEKSEKLLKKINDHDFIIAFCGHFSAGKSTMINALLGENLLPSSPIPTSANLVKIHKAEVDFAKVYYKDEAPYLFEAPYNFSTVKDFCKNGNVTEIEIAKQQTELPENVIVMDTPGVDSTDDAHRISTESAIHLADIVFYVMDYNHVQSELNFLYTKELLQHGVELYLIINQIDKHRDDELSFPEFKMSVQESFAAWNVHPKGIFYTTLKDSKNNHNEFAKVKLLVHEAMKQRDSRFSTSIQSAANLLIQEHFKWLKEQEEEDTQQYKETLEQLPPDERKSILEQEQEFQDKLKELSDQLEDWRKSFDHERTKMLKSAYLMPFQIRELAKDYIEAAQPDFKMGLLFSKKKTEEERFNRLEAFYSQLKTQVESGLIWHMREMATKELKEANLSADDLQLEAQNLTIPFDKEFLQNLVRKGARLSGEYVLHYCDEVAESIKKLAFNELESFKQKAAAHIEINIHGDINAINTKLASILTFANSLRQIEQGARKRNEKEENLFIPVMNFEDVLQELQSKWQQENSNYRIFSNDDENRAAEITETELPKPITNITENESYSADSTISKLQQTAYLLKDKPGFGRITDYLLDKKSRIENRQFTIALFGAFSAGKSSFANALIGEKVLPVSPNPTTAAINRICPPTVEFVHGTAAIHLKSNIQLLEDIQKSLREFNQNCDSLEEAEAIILQIKETNDAREKIHLSFLQAYVKGYPIYKEFLGKDISVGLEEFKGFVANESQSCFVESIDLYYDSELTRKGITLVDTPGADSINARHTGVAFEYIKNSDAVLFVTYYNHAFSKADREFLIQLGRVKDAFELDKMFFIINAIDLADSDDELNDVKAYVNDQLTQYGIRFPKLFGISSLLAIQKDERSGIDDFKNSFSAFLSKDLMKMTIQSAQNEIQRAVNMIDQLMETALEGEEKKEAKKKVLKENLNNIENLLNQYSSEVFVTKLKQEIQELLFYVKQRVFYRFSDFFKEAFNPATLQNNNKSLLNKALNELLESLGYDFAQEMRATSLRIENFIRDLFQKRQELFQEQILNIQSSISLTNYEISSIETPDFQPAFVGIDRSSLERTFKYFKNAKSFFEKNEKKMMEEELQELLQPHAEDYLENQRLMMQEHFRSFVEGELANMLQQINEDVMDQSNALLNVLNEKVDIDEWRRIREQIIS